MTCLSSSLVPVESSARRRIPLGIQTANIVAVVSPFLGLVAGLWLAWGHGFSGLHLALFLGFALLSSFGVTIGYHRLFTHRAFETNRAVTTILAILGGMSVEGPIIKWVAIHRRHHQVSDRPGDPHSPHLHDEHAIGGLAGLWHAHMGWLFEANPHDLSRHAADLLGDPLVRTLSGLWLVWAALGLALPALIAGLITHSWGGAMLGFVWGGLARIFLVHHLTWSINSVCHIWGTRPFQSSDQSCNNVIMGIIGFGEGWHNNHHAFPTSARHGLRWWQFDASYLIIRTLKLLGLAWKVRVPSPSAMLLKQAAAPAR